MALKKLVSDLTQGLNAYPNHNIPSDSGGFNYGNSTSIFDTLSFNQRSFSYLDPLSAHSNPSPLLPQLLPGVNESIEGSIFYLNDAPDGFIRGGEQNALKRAALDNLRINRFFLTGRGLTFIDNQKALQKSNPVIQEGGPPTAGNVLGNFLGDIFGTPNVNLTNRTFNEGNLIKQITEGGYTGIYYNRAGQDPFVQSIEASKYAEMHRPGRNFDGNVVGSFNNISGLRNGNRLLSLGKKLQVGLGNSFNLSNGQSVMEQAVGVDLGGLFSVFDTGLNNLQNFISNPLQALSENNTNNIGFQPGENIIYQYSGGPGSKYGIGDTILFRYQRTSGNYDHQGHPLSIEQYFTDADSEQGESTLLDLITGAVNESIFGGNQILGQNSIFRPGTGLPIDQNSILSGLADTIFGANTVDSLSDLFNGVKPGSGPSVSDSYPDTITIQLVSGEGSVASRSPVKNPIASKITGTPTDGYIEHSKGRVGNKVVPGTKDNKPDDIALKIQGGETPTALGRILGDNKKEGVGKYFGDNRYRVVSGQSPLSWYKSHVSHGPHTIDSYVLGESKGKIYDISRGYDIYFNNKTISGRNYTIENRIGLADAGSTTTEGRKDQINAFDIHEVEDGAFGTDKYRDLVRFRIEAVNTDAPNKSDVMVFRAFLDGWGDNYTANWNSFRYNGRGEEFFTYGGFQRKFNINFKIAAQSEAEMKPLYRKLNFLVSNLAPDYSKSGRMRAPYVRFCVGAYLDRVPGFFTSVNIKWNKNYPYEIALVSPEDKGKEIHVLPHVLDVSLNFTPIHNFIPRKSIEESPFILPGKDTNLYGGPWLTGEDKRTKERTTQAPTGDTYINNDDLSYSAAYLLMPDKDKRNPNTGFVDGFIVGEDMEFDVDGNIVGTGNSSRFPVIAGYQNADGSGAVAQQTIGGSIIKTQDSNGKVNYIPGICFVAGTKVTMKDNSYKNIEDIEVGDLVKSWNEDTEIISDTKVTELFQPLHDDIVVLNFNDTEIKNTFDHPYYVEGKGWSSYKPEWTQERYNIENTDLGTIQQLEVGDICYKYNNGVLEKIPLTNIKEEWGEVQTYIFSLEKDKTFFANNILVHNKR